MHPWWTSYSNGYEHTYCTVHDKKTYEGHKQSRKFFELPEDAKREIEHQPGPNPQRGWSAVGAESTAKLFGDLVPGSSKIVEKDAKVGMRTRVV